MTNTNQTSAPDDNTMSISVESTYTPPSYDVAPEDREIADGIVAMDPFNDVASSAKFHGNRKIDLKASALPPELRYDIEQQVKDVPFDKRADMESKLVAAAIRQQSPVNRLHIGNAPDALPYHQELLSIGAQYKAMLAQRDQLLAEYVEIERYDTRANPETGQPEPFPVYAYSEPRRIQMANQVAELDRNMRLLMDPEGNHGIEGQGRLKRALLESVEKVKELQQAKEDAAEIKQRAALINRERHIQEQAERLAAVQRSEVQ